MRAIEVRICALGALADDDRLELAGFEERRDGEFLVLSGSVEDHPALMGVLELLHRRGLRIRDVEVIGPAPPEGSPSAHGAVVARFELLPTGLLRLALKDSHVREGSTTVALTVELDDNGALFDVLGHLEDLAIEFTRINVRGTPRAETDPAGG
ncbi:MAG: hypothetical protein GX427_00680 [Actinomycetales bacterium]|jgi:hypothetical protein|nr:hypothetical protein [Actinomycetales bacterium]